MTLDSLQLTLTAERSPSCNYPETLYPSSKAAETVNHIGSALAICISQALAFCQMEQVGKLRQYVCFRPRQMEGDT